MTIQIGVGDVFTHKKEHWVIVDVRDDVFVCKNRNTGAIADFDKETVKNIIGNG